MALSFSVLGSGSGGNATLLSLNGSTAPRRLLLDAGLSPRETGRRLEPFGVGLDDVTDILLTHLDSDHFRPTWLKRCAKHSIALRLHESHVRFLPDDLPDGLRVEPFEDVVDLGRRTRVHAIRLAHDEEGTIGFRIQHERITLGFATDLGRVPDELIDFFDGVDALALESNYDRRMQLDSGRPVFLTRRIMGGRGHLSNDESLDGVRRVARRANLSRVALLHLSRQCNDPRLVASLYERHEPDLHPRVTITNQHRATPMLRVTRDPRRRACAFPAHLFDA